MAIVKKKQPTDWLAPFLVKESAVKALQSMILKDDRVSRGGMYCLEIINQITQNGTQVLERIPQEIFCGCPEGGRRNVAASALCRAEGGDMPAKQDTPQEGGLTRIQQIIGAWAERDGCWSDYTDSDQLKAGRVHDPDIDGSEARVFFDDKKEYVYKTIDFSHYPSLSAFLDRVAIHNAIFPETRLTVEGFGWRDDASDGNDYVAVIRQPYVTGNPPDSDEAMDEVDRKLKEKGFAIPEGMWGLYVSESGNILLSDIHSSNCVLTDKGSLLVFDCEAILNQNPALHGKYVIPALTYDENAVKEIQHTISALLPMDLSVEDLLDPSKGFFRSEEDRQKAVFDLCTYQRLREPLTFNGRNWAVQLNPFNSDLCLVSPADSIARMLEHHNGRLDNGVVFTATEMKMLSKGHIVVKEGVRYAFDLDKGRVDSIRKGKKLKLQLDVKADMCPKMAP